MSKGIYVIVCERDTYEPQPDSRPIVFEQHTDNASLEVAKERRDVLSRRYGECRIAKLDFEFE